MSERLAQYKRTEALAERSYPQVALLKQGKGVGALVRRLAHYHRFCSQVSK